MSKTVRDDSQSAGVSRATVGQRLTRRDLLRVAAASGAGALLATGCETTQGNFEPAPPPESMPVATRPAPLYVPDDVTLADLSTALEAGEVSSLELTRQYLSRIARFDQRGPQLRSIIEVNPDAERIALELDRERAERGARGPLHGVPILLKDNIATVDRMATTAGSLALAAFHAKVDAPLATQLRAAGAITLGKANLSEWANFRSTRSTSGWSARGGLCRNPFALDRSACGSSSGSGAAVAAGFAAGAVGTETNGSIVCPAGTNGIVGLKPTVGLISRRGVVPISSSQDTAGPMTRSVRDAAIMLSALAAVDPRDEATLASSGIAHSNYAVFLDPNGLKGARIGVYRDAFGFNPNVDGLMEDALQVMRDAGAEVIDELGDHTLAEAPSHSYEVMLYEFKATLNAFLAELPDSVKTRSLADVIDFNVVNASTELAYFGQDIFIAAEAKGPLTEPAYQQARRQARLAAREDGIDLLVRRHRLDAIVAPTNGPAWKIDLINGDHYAGGSSSPAAIAGYPNLTVPAGFVAGLPIGISFFGRAWSEPTLLRLGYAFEQLTQHRRPPTLRASLNLG